MRSDLNIASEQTPGRSVSARSANRRSREPETRGVGPPSCIWPPSRQADSADHSRDPLRNDWVEPEPPTPLGTEAGVVERLPYLSPTGVHSGECAAWEQVIEAHLFRTSSRTGMSRRNSPRNGWDHRLNRREQKQPFLAELV